MSPRTRTSWRSCEVKPRRSARGWVATGCPSPGPLWTSWRSSRQPCWTVTCPTRTAQEEVSNCSDESLHVSTHQRALSLTRPAPFTPQANPAALTEGHRSPGGTRNVSAPWTISWATFQPSNLPWSQSARSSNRFDCRQGTLALPCEWWAVPLRCKITFFQGGLASCWSACLSSASRHAFTSSGQVLPWKVFFFSQSPARHSCLDHYLSWWTQPKTMFSFIYIYEKKRYDNILSFSYHT